MQTIETGHPRFAADSFFRDYGVYVVLLLLLLANAAITPNFVRLNTVWNMLLQSFPVIIMSLGMAMVIATGGIDISVGSVMGLASIIFSKLALESGTPLALAVAGALAAALVVGLANGVLIGRFQFQPIVVTLAMMMIVRGAAAVANDGKIVTFYDSELVRFGLYRVFGIVPIHAVIIAVAVAVACFVVRKTVFGTYLQAVGDNAGAARLAGVRIFRIILAAYAINALLAAFAAIFETARLASADAINLGNLVEMDCVAAVAVGGTSMRGGQVRIIGTLAGALTMQAITTMVNMNDIPFAYSLLVKSLIIIIALSVQKEK